MPKKKTNRGKKSKVTHYWSAGRKGDIDDFCFKARNLAHPISNFTIRPPYFYDEKLIIRHWSFTLTRDFDIFDFSPPNDESPLWLTPEDGLVKLIEEDIVDSFRADEIPGDDEDLVLKTAREQCPNMQIISVSPGGSYKIDPKYKEFKQFLDYALGRFPQIRDEVTQRILEKRKHNIFENRTEDELLDYYGRAQHEIFAAFYNLFCKAVLRAEKLTTRQIQSLIDRAEPLKQKSKQIAYYELGVSRNIYGRVPAKIRYVKD